MIKLWNEFYLINLVNYCSLENIFLSSNQAPRKVISPLVNNRPALFENEENKAKRNMFSPQRTRTPINNIYKVKIFYYNLIIYRIIQVL